MSTKFTVRDRWTFGLAVGVLLRFFLFFGIALIDGAFYSSPNDYSGIEKVSATIGLLPASIIGYYFGQRPVQALTEQIRETTSRGSKAKATVALASFETTPTSTKEIEVLKQQLQVKDEIIQHLIKKTVKS